MIQGTGEIPNVLLLVIMLQCNLLGVFQCCLKCQIVVKHVMDERATFVCGTQVDPRMLLDSASFISKFYIKIASTISSAGVHDEEEEEINAN